MVNKFFMMYSLTYGLNSVGAMNNDIPNLAYSTENETNEHTSY